MNLEFTIPRKKPYKNVYQFKITLLGTKPLIWRRIFVPETFGFYDLHVAIQDAMGWEDYHLHRFEKRKSRSYYGNFDVRIDCMYATGEYEPEGNTIYDTETPIKDYFKKKEDKLFYSYDFGDNWEHEVILEKISPKNAKCKYPLCSDGEHACPPEDCGSIPG